LIGPGVTLVHGFLVGFRICIQFRFWLPWEIVECIRWKSSCVLKGGDGKQRYLPTMHFEQSILLKATQQTTDCFHRKAEMIADVMPRHTQVEYAGGVTAFPKAPGQIKQKPAHAYLCLHPVEQP
jgi:hypothetical protein